ncbi:hypothetical protein FisN_7Hu334 [Fistulifera solaris]|uniref:Uncharacterized protein n=1 Tax=Fistulifera solaris TaxID=1519565 RepID=A0A1Z5KRX9_FISSO|nr:hypothetical protein FisN_7Hu334 [Fistulifera solaris]|eukprot:GAX29073.1 hypothetical protein FisN_7Hu334 [Fistulifera solaris]
MIFHLFSLNTHKPQPQQARSAVELHAVVKLIDHEDPLTPIPMPLPNKLRRALYTIEEDEVIEMPGAPRVTMRKRVKMEERIVDESHVSPVAISTKRKHRRSKAMDEDDFSKITMVCEDLHHPQARLNTRSPAIWNHSF